MRGFSLSIRIGLIAVMLLIASVAVTNSLAQNTTPAPGAETAPAQRSMGIFQMIGDNLDFVFFTIFGLSVVALSLIIQGFLQNRQSVFLPPATLNHIKSLIQQRRYRDLLDFTTQDQTFISRVLNPALRRAPSFAAMKEAMETALSENSAEQFRKIEYLNIIGNLGPLLGLLGTVLGMIKAFGEMHAAGGQANPAHLAGGISTALTHTFLGLMLAVPCLGAFGVLRTMVDRLTVKGTLVAEELLLMIKSQDNRPAAQTSAPTETDSAETTDTGPAPVPGAVPT